MSKTMSRTMSETKSAQQKTIPRPARRERRDPDSGRSPQNDLPQDDLVSARRKLCTFLRFWKVCGHKPCRRAKSCAQPSNECFGRFWPLVPESVKHAIRAGIEAKSAGLPASGIAAAIKRALARWRETQGIFAPDAAAPQVPPRPNAAPSPVAPRLRVL